MILNYDCLCGFFVIASVITGSILMIGDFFDKSFTVGLILISISLFLSVTYSCVRNMRQYRAKFDTGEGDEVDEATKLV